MSSTKTSIKDSGYESTYDKKGEQGTLKWIVENGVTFAEKTSQYIDYTIEMETDIGVLLNTLHSDHFCHYYVDASKHDKSVSTLKMDKIEGNTLFETELNQYERQSIVGRTLTIMSIVTELFDISHNDLHSSNVMVKNTEVDVQGYIFPDGEEMAAPTFGWSPVIIDFGLAFSGHSSRKMKSSINHSEIGFFPHERDEFADARRLLSSIQDMPDDIVKLLINDVEYKPCGWFVEKTFPDIMAEIYKHIGDSPIIGTDELSLFAAHISLPLRRVSCHDFKTGKPIDLGAILTKLDSYCLTPFELKCALDNNVSALRPQFTKHHIREIRRLANKVVLALNNIILDVATEASMKKAKLYEKIPVGRARDIARMMMDAPVVYWAGMRVSVYCVAKRTTRVVVISKATAVALTNGASLSCL